jgi:hypothetical protein
MGATSTKPPTAQFLAELHASMSDALFHPDEDGFAVRSEIAREVGRSISWVSHALAYGEEQGLFASRPHPSMIDGATRRPVRQYRALR